ncbi:hypothetical protein NL676_024600 [Syzygium grande]|nr:hypothetical protein NL676_024600 [Syzygium grande]
MSHFGRSGPPDITDTYSLLILNISFRTTADDLFPLFDKYGKVVDVFIPRDRRTGESRGFAFVRYKYADEAQKAVDKLDGVALALILFSSVGHECFCFALWGMLGLAFGFLVWFSCLISCLVFLLEGRVVDGREIGVQFAKYGPNAERIDKGKIAEPVSKIRRRSRSRSPRPRYRDEYRDRDYRRRSRSRSRGRYDRDRNRDRERSYRHQSRSYSASPDCRKDRRSPKYDDEDRSRSGSYRSSSHSPQKAEHERSPSPNQRPSTLESPDPSLFSTHHHWYSSLLHSFPPSDPPSQILYTYRATAGSFSTHLTAPQAEALRRALGVLSIVLDRIRHLHTTWTPHFLGLTESTGLWPNFNYADNIIIRVLDTWIWPERQSFFD